jgi:deoxyribodipyrimidine photo-lyase
MIHNLSLFIFRRDLRLTDNTGLIKALSESKLVIPLFIFTPAQVSNKNKFKSSNAVQFMIESLYDLDEKINKLWTIYGDELDIINDLYQKYSINAIYINEDYTPYSIKRDSKIKKYCDKNNIILNVSTDVLLIDRIDITAKNGNYYHQFTMFHKNALQYPVRKPFRNRLNNFKRNKSKQWSIEMLDKFLLDNNYYEINENLAVHGGRKHALKILGNVHKMQNYKHDKQFPEYPTTKLSAHLKFGNVSVREAYYIFLVEKSGELVRGLYWRDFYYYVGFHFDDFYKYQYVGIDHSFQYQKWEHNDAYLIAWQDGKTGFPFVDAAMQEMNTTGFMHNRGRLIVSQFLTKDLLIDWKYGENYFSRTLVDIDRAQNLGNWNWSASYGLDNSPFLRIFNPWTQSATYDPKCNYIKKWLPQLSNVEPKHIHKWFKYHSLYPNINYPKPIIDHATQRKKFIKYYTTYTRSIKK